MTEAHIRCTKADRDHAYVEVVTPTGVYEAWTKLDTEYRIFAERLGFELKLAIVDRFRRHMANARRHQGHD